MGFESILQGFAHLLEIIFEILHILDFEIEPYCRKSVLIDFVFFESGDFETVEPCVVFVRDIEKGVKRKFKTGVIA